MKIAARKCARFASMVCKVAILDGLKTISYQACVKTEPWVAERRASLHKSKSRVQGRSCLLSCVKLAVASAEQGLCWGLC